MLNLENLGKAAKDSARQLYTLEQSQKNLAIQAIAQALRTHTEAILSANAQDIAAATNLPEHLQDRLRLDPSRLEAIAREAEHVARLKDPVGEEFDQRILPGGMKIKRRRVPLGVIGVIYEARPNVTVDVACLCLKSGNAAILRGGKETRHTNAVLAQIIQDALLSVGLPVNAIQLIADPDRQHLHDLLRLDTYVDMIIPRGGAGLHQFCREHSTIPVITGGIGVCHLYADAFLDLDMAVPVIVNAKVQRPSVCNALDTLLVHETVAPDFLPLLADALAANQVQIRADLAAHNILKEHAYPYLSQATHEDFGTEFLALILSIRVVHDLEEALEHIAQYSSGHSDGILTLKQAHAERFLNEVDSAAVYVNASTRFTDGAQFGLGAEVAVSTQKLHARGPMGLEALTTYKWIVEGRWNARP